MVCLVDGLVDGGPVRDTVNDVGQVVSGQEVDEGGQDQVEGPSLQG